MGAGDQETGQGDLPAWPGRHRVWVSSPSDHTHPPHMLSDHTALSCGKSAWSCSKPAHVHLSHTQATRSHTHTFTQSACAHAEAHGRMCPHRGAQTWCHRRLRSPAHHLPGCLQFQVMLRPPENGKKLAPPLDGGLGTRHAGRHSCLFIRALSCCVSVSCGPCRRGVCDTAGTLGKAKLVTWRGQDCGLWLNPSQASRDPLPLFPHQAQQQRQAPVTWLENTQDAPASYIPGAPTQPSPLAGPWGSCTLLPWPFSLLGSCCSKQV